MLARRVGCLCSCVLALVLVLVATVAVQLQLQLQQLLLLGMGVACSFAVLVGWSSCCGSCSASARRAWSRPFCSSHDDSFSARSFRSLQVSRTFLERLKRACKKGNQPEESAGANTTSVVSHCPTRCRVRVDQAVEKRLATRE